MSTRATGRPARRPFTCTLTVPRSSSRLRRHRSRTGQIFTNPNGSHSTYSTRDGAFLDTANAFFQPLGTNDRACASCHQVEDAHGPQRGARSGALRKLLRSRSDLPARRRLEQPHRRRFDDARTRRDAYSLLLSKGLIRVQLPVPATAQFEVIAVDDPYGNSTGQPLPLTQISVFRRPLSVHEPEVPRGDQRGGAAERGRDARHHVGRARDSNQPVHRPDEPGEQRHTDSRAGRCSTPQRCADLDRRLRARALHRAGDRKCGRLGQHRRCKRRRPVPFDGAVHRWRKSRPEPDQDRTSSTCSMVGSARLEARDAIARGQALFNFRVGINPLSATCASNVPNDCAPGAQAGAQAMTCTRCHSTFETGGQDGGAFGNSIGNAIGNFTSGGLAGEFRTPDLPLYTLRQKAAPERDPEDDRSWARDDHGCVGRREQVQGTLAPRFGGTRALLPQWLGRDAGRRRRCLSKGRVPVQFHSTGEG